MRVINGGLFIFAGRGTMGYIVAMGVTTDIVWLRLFLWLLVIVLLAALGGVILWVHFRKKRAGRGFEVMPEENDKRG